MTDVVSDEDQDSRPCPPRLEKVTEIQNRGTLTEINKCLVSWNLGYYNRARERGLHSLQLTQKQFIKTWSVGKL